MHTKKIFIFIVLVFAPIANTVFANTYTSRIDSPSGFEKLSKQKISEISLLQTYVLRYKDKINDTYSIYSKNPSSIIIRANNTLEEMNEALSILLQSNLWTNNTEKVMKEIINDLKTLNSRLKVYFQQEKDTFDQNMANKKIQYQKIWDQISQILDKLIDSQTQRLLKIKELSSNDKKLIQILLSIQSENTKIKEFKNIRFESEATMKIYFQNIIKKLRQDLKDTKKYL